MILTTLLTLNVAAAGAPAAPPVLADLYVDASATSCASATGSAAAPYCTIEAALTAAVDGDRILIAPGTYTENLSVVDDVEIVGLEGREVTIVDGGAAGSVITIASDVMVTIDGLTVQNGRAYNGGGILSTGSLTLRNSTVRSSSAGISNGNCYYPFGGGISILYGGATAIVQCEILGNGTLATCSYAYGGGIAALRTESLLISSSTISGNGVGPGGRGGALFSGDTPLTIENSTISGNIAEAVPVDITSITSPQFPSCPPLVVRNTTLSANYGGGIRVVASCGVPALLDRVTVANNTNAYSPPFVSQPIVTAYGSTGLEVRNSVIAGNFGNGLELHGQVTSLGHNFIGSAVLPNGVNGDQVGTPFAELDPMLAFLGANGGATDTLAPLPFSPLIDAGDPAFAGTTDQRGFVRIGAPDIGAHEYASFGAPRILGCISTPNTTGRVGATAAVGRPSVGDNALTLVASALPANTPVLFVGSRSPGFTPNPGFSVGNLCLSGAIGRFVGPGQLSNSGTAGRAALAIDLDALPAPMGPVAAIPGDTWYFQAWHRDASLAGVPTSNFTAGTRMTLTP